MWEYVSEGHPHHQLDLLYSEEVETLADRHIRDLSDHEYLLHVNQHLYKALHPAVSTIREHVAAKGYAMGAFIDIEGAFNHTSREVIVKALNRHQTSSFVNRLDRPHAGSSGS